MRIFGPIFQWGGYSQNDDFDDKKTFFFFFFDFGREIESSPQFFLGTKNQLQCSSETAPTSGWNVQDFSKNLNKLLKAKIPSFPINGEFLKKKGMREGKSLGNVLKILEKEWIEKNFKMSDERVKEIINIYSN